ncbi:MAG TPA: caspase family protein [Gammaproteobacteria bacterium]
MISGPGKEGADDYLKGVEHDIRGYQAHLLSPQGGLWDAQDVNILRSPTVSQVRDWLRMYGSRDYTFIMFSGHGAFSTTDRDPFVELSPGQNMAGLELRTCNGKRTVILDSCQRYTAYTTKLALLAEVYKADSAGRRPPSPARCRQRFLNEIEAAANMVVPFYSCSPGEYSYDDPTSGGLYNCNVLGAIDNWVEGQARKIGGASASYSTISAHNDAKPKTEKESGGRQHPTLLQPKSGPYFPIAVYES